MKDVEKIPGVNFEDDVQDELKPIDDKARETAINALKGLNHRVEESSPFKPKQKAALKKVQDDVLTTLDKCGYDTRSAGVQLAVSLLVDNLSRQ